MTKFLWNKTDYQTTSWRKYVLLVVKKQECRKQFQYEGL